MGAFKGFNKDAIFLMELNKFNDSKDFYEGVKEEIKAGATVPMRNLASDLSGFMYKIDPLMVLNPVKMVSRIRRDTRRSKNKELYRANMWCMFMRDKNQFKNQPCMWFEFYPGYYSYGVGIFGSEPSFMEFYREHFKDNQKRYKAAIKKIEAFGALPDVMTYKKPKPGSDEIEKALKPYYNSKYIYFIKTNNNIENLYSEKLYDELSEAYKIYAPFYKLLLEAHENSIEKGE